MRSYLDSYSDTLCNLIFFEKGCFDLKLNVLWRWYERIWVRNMSVIQSFLFLLASEESKEGDTLHSHNFETDTRNISFGFTLLTESSNQHLIVFSEIVKATVPWYESSNLLSILFEHNSNSLSDGRVGLFWLYTDLFDNKTLGHATTHEGILESRTEQSSIVLLIVPPAIIRCYTSEVYAW